MPGEYFYGTKHSKQVLQVHAYGTKEKVKRHLWEQQKLKPEFKTFPRRNFNEGLRDQRPSAHLFDVSTRDMDSHL